MSHKTGSCEVLCYCRSDTPSGRHPRPAKLAWTPSRLLLLHFNPNNKTMEKFEEIISKLQSHPEEVQQEAKPRARKASRKSSSKSQKRRDSQKSQRQSAKLTVPPAFEPEPVIIE